MIVLFVHHADADALQNLLLQRGFTAITRQIAPQWVLERLLPTDAFPVLSVRYEDENRGVDIYDDALAAAMYSAMQDAARLVRQKQDNEAPLFAGGRL